MAATASPISLPAISSQSDGAGSGFLDLARYPDLVGAFTDEPRERIALSRAGESWHATGPNSRVEVRTELGSETLAVKVSDPEVPLTRVHLRWKLKVPVDVLVLGDAWERSYGDLAWRGIVPERPLPWYFATHQGGITHGYGVRTGASAFCFWQLDAEGVSLWLDLGNGGSGVLLGSRELHAATVVSHQGHSGESPRNSIAALCRKMCPTPRLTSSPVYGTNDWYYAYGNNSAEGILRDTDLIVALAPKGGVRPFSVVDGGWAGSGGGSDIVVPNPKFPDMAGLVGEIRRRGARPGIWIRPTLAPKSAKPELLLPESRFPSSGRSGNEPVYDPTIPEALQAMLAKVTQVVDWKYELVKHDYSTFDLFGQWGSQMGGRLTHPGWAFHDRSRTNAEIVLDLYQGIRSAAGPDTIVLGCNTVGHLGAGLFELQRTGDDTSGRDWERTRRMGINTLAYRIPQNGTFFTVDADCVGITQAIPWELNRQWLDLIARSGSALFLSPSPDAVGPEQKADIAAAFAIAAAGNATGYPVDWLNSTTPQYWQFNTGKSSKPVERQYDWCGATGCDPYPI
jgi:alpha-galactosidase